MIKTLSRSPRNALSNLSEKNFHITLANSHCLFVFLNCLFLELSKLVFTWILKNQLKMRSQFKHYVIQCRKTSENLYGMLLIIKLKTNSYKLYNHIYINYINNLMYNSMYSI